MTAVPVRWPGRVRVALAIVAMLPGLGATATQAAPDRSHTRAAATPPYAAAFAQLQSPRLPYAPLPPPRVKPVLRELVDRGWSVNADLQTQFTPLPAYRRGLSRIECYEVRFTSHYLRGKPVSIFGFYGFPASHGRKLPALLLIHGGGGYATLDRVLDAARRGYAALSIDLPGKGALRERFSRSTGPDMTVKQIFTVKPELGDNYLYNAVLAQMRAITFLSRRPEVDPQHIGLVGVSWGGATGLITTSLDKRVKCFVDMFGSGLLRGGSTWHDYFDRLPADEFQQWEDNFDASRYVADITVPVLGLTGTNDNCYYLPRFMSTLMAIRPTPDLLLRPNLDHKIDEVAREGYYKWLAVHLKGTNAPSPPGLQAWRVIGIDKGVRTYIQPRGRVGVARAEVCYGEVGDIGWTNRRWKTVRAVPDRTRSWWVADIPLPSQITYAFATVYFVDGSVLTTPVNSLACARIDNSMVALYAPLMYTGPLRVEAHYLAGVVNAAIKPDPTSARVALFRDGRKAELNARRLGALYFVGLREVCEQLGGQVGFNGQHTTVVLPPHGAAEVHRPASRHPS